MGSGLLLDLHISSVASGSRLADWHGLAVKHFLGHGGCGLVVSELGDAGRRADHRIVWYI